LLFTQVPDASYSIVNTIEDIATFIVNFFSQFYAPNLRKNEDEDDIEAYTMTPENTIFVEYLPTHCFRPDDGHDRDTFAIMRFSWEIVLLDQNQDSWYYKANAPRTSVFGSDMWKHTNLHAVNDLIEWL
jgi:hypothetical protein